MLDLEHIVELLRNAYGESTRRGDLRRHPRLGIRIRTTVLPCPADGSYLPPEQAWVRDLSRGGAGLSMPVRWPPETRFGLVVPSIRGVSRTLLYGISNIRPQRDGALLVGARLLEPYEFEELRHELLRLHPKEAAMPFDLAGELDRSVLRKAL